MYTTRSEKNGSKDFETIKEALEYASNNPDIWKVSFSNRGSAMRLVRTSEGWTYENIFGNRYK